MKTVTKNSTKGRSCKGKRKYASEQRARYAINEAEGRGAAPGRIIAYPCRFGCQGWHIGHAAPGRR